jgi:hypothetical protein
MKIRARMAGAAVVGACVMAGGVPTVAMAGSVRPSDSSAGVTTSTAGTPVCVLNPNEKSVWSADIAAGMSSADICSNSSLVAANGATPAATAACEGIVLIVVPNNPKAGWFHENESWSGSDDILVAGDFTAKWSNETTGGGNSFSWTPAGQIDFWSGTHNVYSKAGNVKAWTYGNGVVENALGGYNDCTYPPSNKASIHVN